MGHLTTDNRNDENHSFANPPRNWIGLAHKMSAMTWITFLWPMVTAACITMGLIHLWIGLRRTPGTAHKLFALAAFAVAVFSVLELAMIRADSPARFLELQRWIDFVAGALVASLAAFVWVYFGTGRKWLALLAVGVTCTPLILDLLPVPKLIFLQITAVRTVETFGGATYTVAEGIRNPWHAVFYMGVLLLVVFVADASVTLWRRGARRRAVRVGGSITFFLLVAGVQAALVDGGVINAPYIVSFCYLAILMAMGVELSDDLFRSVQLAQDLHESEMRMELAADAAGVGVWIWSIQDNRIWGSERWRRLFEFSPHETVTYEQAVGRIHPDDREPVERGLQRALAERTDYAEEFRVMTPDSSERWIGVRARLSAQANATPARMRMMGAAIDITARRQLEQRIEQQRNELAHLSRINMLSELSGSLAHELNQPLGIILSNAQAAQRLIVQEPPDLAEVRDILADIVSEDERAGEVIRRMRAMLKSGPFSLQPLAINETVEEVLRLVRSDLISNGIAVHVTCAASVPQVLGDPIQLQQVLLNLILNACDAMAANSLEGRHLSIATTHGKGCVRVSVADTGCGLPAEIERVFEPFHTTKKEGLGLGLSICRSIVSAHNGRLWAQARGATASGRGATFCLELPAMERPSGEGRVASDKS